MTEYGMNQDQPHLMAKEAQSIDEGRITFAPRDQESRRDTINKDWGEYGGRTLNYGKGPKNYRRPDESIKDEIYQRLTWNPEIDASNINIEVREGNIHLSGEVENRRMRWLAEEIIEDISGVKDIHNGLRVTY